MERTLIYIAGLAASFLFGYIIFFVVYRHNNKRLLKNTEEEVKKIKQKALKEAEVLKKEAILEAKESLYSSKSEFERQTKERRLELQKIENRLLHKEENLDRKLNLLDQKEESSRKIKKDIETREHRLKEDEVKIAELLKKQQRELEKISGLTVEDAKKMLLESLTEEVKHESAAYIKKVIDQESEIAERKAKDIICTAIQRCAADQVLETTVSVVDLPNDEMKGRIIGREGRNIRALETATGIDLIIDDTPEAVILSGFDSIRREIAATVLKRLIVDGRIHPARIEELVKKVEQEVELGIKEEGEQAVFECGIHNVHQEIVKLIGRLKYRTSYAQNVLQHSKEVSFIAGIMAEELGLKEKIARRAGLLHDIGKAVDHKMDGAHAKIGADLARKYNESPEIIHAIEAHHYDIEPKSMEAVLVHCADALSAARPGARREILESYIKRLEKLESIAETFKGVEKTYAIQAGREIRILVKPEDISDSEMALLARDIAKKIEEELEYPGEIKVTVIREMRSVEYAR
ncbi:MAG: ribonuclease Y [Candidatus Schekmanbacteria bacterium RBG_13_48_7]|uniref:Ribonuclease Y n=1 Tax=Candidatus Schekmanbacteria bacterium RBG_13_48_7 TaxID=1817878 RepID=A0A1F7RQM7_9BACT|nr:MAG: ribonuclease Y [Candidatus Schekmanbacteria bacterium RBG_13_48_7]